MRQGKNKIQPIDAAGGVLYRPLYKSENGSQADAYYEVLLILRRGVWDLPKGKREESESFERCAVREVEEETGAPSPVIQGHLTDTYHEYPDGSERMGKTTRWYAMTTGDPDFTPIPQQEEEIERVRWTPLPDAREIVGFENLAEVLDLFQKKFSAGSKT
ncbi:MAG: NUDIX domain-containing protein [Balneolaceae bacterium]